MRLVKLFYFRLPLLLMVVAGIVGACGSQAIPFEQHVEISVTSGGQPKSGVALGLFGSEQCKGPVSTGISDSAGHIDFQRHAVRGKHAVLLQRLSLCERRGETWTQVWSQAIDPPDNLVFVCEASSRSMSCKDARD